MSFTSLCLWNRKKEGWRRRLLFPWATAGLRADEKLEWFTEYQVFLQPPSAPPPTPRALLDPSSCPLVAVYPMRGHRYPSSDYFCVPAHCLELSGSLPDLNTAFRQLNMAFVMDGWQPRASILGLISPAVGGTVLLMLHTYSTIYSARTQTEGTSTKKDGIISVCNIPSC